MEFRQLLVMIVYIHAKANVDLAKRAMRKSEQRPLEIPPDAPNFIMNNFNPFRQGKAMSNFHQYVTFAAHLTKDLGICYGSMNGALRCLCICLNLRNTTHYTELQKEVKQEIKLAKRRYNDKVGNLLSAGSSCPACGGVKLMMGMQSTRGVISKLCKTDPFIC